MQELRSSGIHVLGDVPWGTHFCQFYRTKEDLLDVLVPYFVRGLQDNEFCIWVTSSPLAEKEAYRAIKEALPAFDQYAAKGQIEILPHTEWYLKGGRFDVERVLNGWIEKLNSALARGYEGLRLTGNTFWLEKEDWQSFLDYETEINRLIGRHPMIALCTYCLDRCGITEILDVAGAHRLALIKKDDQWVQIRSSAAERSETIADKVLVSSLNGLYIHDLKEGRNIFINPQYTKLTGYSLEDINALSGPEFFALFHPEDQARVATHLEAISCAADGDTLEFEYRFKTADGRWIWCFSRDTVFERDDDGTVRQILGTFLDITERHRMDMALHESEERFRSVLEHSLDAAYRRNLQTNQYDFMSPVIEQIIGYTSDEMKAVRLDKVLERIHPDDRQHVKQEIERTLGGGKGLLEYRFQAKDGKYRWLEDSIAVLTDREGCPLYRIGIVRDVTARKQTEEALRQQTAELEATRAIAESEERRLEAVMEALPVGVAITDTQGGNIKSNKAYEQIWGEPCPAARTISDYAAFKAWWAETGTPLRPEEWASAQAVEKGVSAVGQLLEIQRFDGSHAFVINSASPVFDANGHIIGSAVAIQDITSLRKAEQALRESEARFKLLSETAGQLLTTAKPRKIINDLCRQVMVHLDCHAFFNFLVDEQAGRLRLNAYAGIPEREALKIEWLDYGVSVSGCVARDAVPIVVDDILNKPDPRTELVKSYGIQAYACYPLMTQARLIGTLSFGTKTRARFLPQELAILKTLTDQIAVAVERTRLIRELQRSRDELELRVRKRTAELESRNRELQEFAFAASHDLQEPLRKIQTFGDMLVKKFSESINATGQDYLTRMQNAAARMQNLVTSLLSYSRTTTRQEPFKLTPLRESVEEAISNLEVLIEKKGALVEVAELPTIEADRVQMVQLFQNLIGNALKFQRENVPPHVKISSQPEEKRERENRWGYEISVQDNGIGFDEAYLDKIFMPFQRLHGRSEFGGVGMGLAIAKKIAERHGGQISAKSAPGKGATFVVTLPSVQEKS